MDVASPRVAQARLAQARLAQARLAQVGGCAGRLLNGRQDFAGTTDMNESSSGDRDKEKLDPRLKRFLSRAVPVIAEERGVNERSLIKIRSIATELRLPVDLYQRGLRRLKRIGTGQHLSRYEREFVRYLKRQFRQLSSSILTVTAENQIVEYATQKFQLPADRAREIITQRAMKYGIGRISRSEAERHVELMIADRIRSSTFVDEETRQRLYSFGQEWGVDEARIDSIAEQILSQNRETRLQRQRSRGPMLILLAGCGLAIAIATVLIIQYRGSRLQADTEEGPSQSANSTASDRVQFAGWWNMAQQLEVARLSNRWPAFSQLLEQLADEQPQQRKTGVVRCIDLLFEDDIGGETDSREVVYGIIASEPDQTNRQQAAEHLLRRLMVGSFPEDSQEIADAFFSIQLYIEFVTTLDADSAFANYCRSRFAEQLGMDSGPELDSLEQAQRRYARQLMNRCREFTWQQPEQVIAVLPKLLNTCRRHLLDREFQLARNQIVINLLRAAPEKWERFDERITMSIEQCEREDLIPWIDIVETTEQGGLRRRIQFLISDKYELSIEPIDRPQVARELRAAIIGGDSTRGQFGRRRAKWLERVRQQNLAVAEMLGGELPDFETDSLAHARYWDQLAQRVAVSARLATLGLALKVGRESGEYAEFDQRIDQDWEAILALDPISLRRLDLETFGQTTRLAEQGDRARLAKLVEQVRTGTTSERGKVLEQIAALASRFPEISDAQADVLATYCFAELPAGERLVVWQSLPSFRHWYNVHAAFLRQLPETRLAAAECCQLVKSLVGQQLFDIEFNGDSSDALDENLRLQLRRSLVRSCLARDSYLAKLSRSRGRWASLYERLRSELQWRVRIVQESVGDSVEPQGGTELLELCEIYGRALIQLRRGGRSVTPARIGASRLSTDQDHGLRAYLVLARRNLELLANVELGEREALRALAELNGQLAEIDHAGQQLLIIEHFGLEVLGQAMTARAMRGGSE